MVTAAPDASGVEDVGPGSRASNEPCHLCGGGCAGADLTPLLGQHLGWLWSEVAAAADRRGDPDLTTGTLVVRLPAGAPERAAAAGLVGGRLLAAGGSRRVELAELTRQLRGRGAMLTPGAVAAHSVGRPLAVRAQLRADRAARESALERAAADLVACRPIVDAAVPRDELWTALRRTGWVARLVQADDGERLLRQAAAVLSSLPSPGDRADRRRLADAASGNPHALDQGSPLAGLVIAVLAAADVVGGGLRARAAWNAVGVDCDDLTGGLITVGIHPDGWTVPAGATVTLPPRELAAVAWARPSSAGWWVFVTENPSVAAAAADLVRREQVPVRVICTSGTPSLVEIAAIGRLPDVGWRVAVRADFDEAGLTHVRSLLAGVPDAVAWRMGASDYRASLRSGAGEVALSVVLGETPWDPDLAAAMAAGGVAAFEESLLEELLSDLRRGGPEMSSLQLGR